MKNFQKNLKTFGAAALAFFASASLALPAPAPLPVVGVAVNEVAATQTEVGRQAVNDMMIFWAEKSGGSQEGFETYLKEKIFGKTFPGVVGPDIWGGSATRTYILDGHHRASAAARILYDDYDTLPSAVQKVMNREMQAAWQASPQMKFQVAVEKTFSSANDLVTDFAVSGRGQLPPGVRLDKAFAEALEKMRSGSATAIDLQQVLAGYQKMAPTLAALKDNPLRSAVGATFFNAGINSDSMVPYIEFVTAEKIEKKLLLRGVNLTSENSTSPEIITEVKRAIFEDKELLDFLRSVPRQGTDAAATLKNKTDNLAQFEKALEKYNKEKAASDATARMLDCVKLFEAVP